MFLFVLILSGFGSVHKALHKQSGYFLAVKIVKGCGISDAIRKEVDILKDCRNDHIVSYYGTLVDKQDIWVLYLNFIC